MKGNRKTRHSAVGSKHYRNSAKELRGSSTHNTCVHAFYTLGALTECEPCVKYVCARFVRIFCQLVMRTCTALE